MWKALRKEKYKLKDNTKAKYRTEVKHNIQSQYRGKTNRKRAEIDQVFPQHFRYLPALLC